jgi:glutathione synthase/RimK-type ligase-like ATP-grasp enzyme
MMAEVPIVGWDVAFTPNGIYLLEVNLSCNFFRGSFDLPGYIDMLNKYWIHLEKIEKLSEEPRTPSRKKYSRGSLKKE